MTSNDKPQVLCLKCNEPGTDHCAQCKSARYCSKKCQSADWPVHKLLCKDFSKFDMSERPSDKHFRVIHFPVDGEKPRVIWLRCHWKEWNDALGPFLDGTNDSMVWQGDRKLCRNMVLDRQLSGNIFLTYRDDFLCDGSKPNKSIASITDTKQGQYYPFRGSFVAYGAIGFNEWRTATRDLGMDDFRHIADWFLTFRSSIFSAWECPFPSKFIPIPGFY